jgi:arylsulfatase A-like enzyme
VFSHNGYTAQSRFHAMSGSLAGLRGNRTLIDDFKANGYEVAYFSGQDESFGGLAVGFDRADVAYDARHDRQRRYSTFSTPGSLAIPYTVVQERVAAFLARRSDSRPLFLYLNFHDTHYPYHHDGMRPLASDTILAEAQITPDRARALREMYLNAAANVDRAIGETLALLREHLSAEPGVIVTADHGESLFDEGFLGHGYALNDAQTRIPLIVTGLPLVIDEPFGQVELRDAIAHALSAPGAATSPHVRPRSDKKVFQYLGSVDRPRQIAFTSGDGRTLYDFRTGRVRLAERAWQRPGELDDDGVRQFLELVHFWERVVLARSELKRGADE